MKNIQSSTKPSVAKRRLKAHFWLDLPEQEYMDAVSRAVILASYDDYSTALSLASLEGLDLNHQLSLIKDAQEDKGSLQGLFRFIEWLNSLKLKTIAGRTTLGDFISQSLLRLENVSLPEEEKNDRVISALGKLPLVLKDKSEGKRLEDLLDRPLLELILHDVVGKLARAEWRSEFLELPLERQPYNGSQELVSIDLRAIPPNFVHTWGIDISKDVECFKLSFDSIQNIQLMWNPSGPGGDCLSVIDSCGNVLARFWSLYEIQVAAVPLKAIICNHDEGHTHKRIYLVLETSTAKGTRCLVLKKLRLLAPKTNATEALLVDDPVNYSTTNVFVDAVNQVLYPPWYASNQTGSMPGLIKPEQSKGWRLLAINVTNTASQFYSLVYYNELTSKLGFYLFNRTLPKAVSGFVAEISLLGQQETTIQDGLGNQINKNQYVRLKGAFFHQGTRPKDWAKARVPIPKWEQGRWTYFEIPVLYPMAEELPLDFLNLNPAGNPYVSLYEDPFKEGMRNVKMEIKIVWQLQLDETSNLIAKALGDAVQKMPAQQGSLADFALKMSDSVKQGYDWGKGAYDFVDGLKKYKNDATWGPIVGSLLPAAMAAGAGAGVFAGVVAAVGAVISLLKNLLAGDPEPLRFAIELGIRGEIKGIVQGNLQEATSWFYLPGRFSIEEAFDPAGIEGLPQDNIRFIDSILPRYQYTLGLFGYMCHPRNLKLNVDMLQHQRVAFPANRQWVTPLTCMLQNKSVNQCKAIDNKIEQLLPVIRNDFGPRMFMLPTCQYKGKGLSNAYIKVFMDELGYDCGACVWANFARLPEGVTLLVTDFYVPLPVADFKPTYDVHFEFGNDLMEQYISSDSPWKDYPAWSSMFHWVSSPGEQDQQDIHPIHDVLFYWDLSYLVWDRQGNTHKLTTQLCAPISINFKRFEITPSNKIKEVAHNIRESMLLR